MTNYIEFNDVNTITLTTINDNNIFTIIHMNARSIVFYCDDITTLLNSFNF